MGTTGIGFKFCSSRKINCELWNELIGFPVGEVFVIHLTDSLIAFPNLGSSLTNLVLGVSSSWSCKGSLQAKSTETVA